MATEAIEVVSLEEMKAELPAASHREEALKVQIASAVSFVSRLIEAPLVDITETIHIPRPADAHWPLAFRALAVKSVDKVEYWTPSGNLREDPDGTAIENAQLGRLVSRNRDNTLYPPGEGWPDILPDSPLVLTVTRGLEFGDEHKALKQAVILLVRQFYDGFNEMRPTSAVFALIAPWRRYD